MEGTSEGNPDVEEQWAEVIEVCAKGLSAAFSVAFRSERIQAARVWAEELEEAAGPETVCVTAPLGVVLRRYIEGELGSW